MKISVLDSVNKTVKAHDIISNLDGEFTVLLMRLTLLKQFDLQMIMNSLLDSLIMQP